MMRRAYHIPVFVLLLFIFILQLMVSFSVLGAGKPARTRVMIGYFNPPGLQDEKDILFRGGSVRHRYRTIPAIAAEMNEAALAGIRRNPNVKYVEFDQEVHIVATPDDDLFSDLWGLHNTGQTGGLPGADIDAPKAWDVQTGSSDVVIAVIDTGVDYTHEDLSGNMWKNPGETEGDGIDNDFNGFIDDVYGWDFYNNDSDPMDDHDHGTHCSGTIAAVGDNGTGVTGVNWDARIMALKFLSASGSGSTADAVAAVDYATWMRLHYGINVVVTSNSWGGGGFLQTLEDAISAANDAGILFIAAAGNDSTNNDGLPHYPSSYEVPNVIAVAATDHNDQLAYFSNYGITSVDLAAPGVGILSTVPGGYASFDGTSMATPHVAGVAGLVRAQFSELEASHIDIKYRILGSVDNIPGLPVATGGRLNAYTALTISPYPIIAYQSHSVDDNDGGDGDGLADPDETIELVVTLKNSWVAASSVTATLHTDDPDVISVLSPDASFSDIPANGSGSSFYSVEIDPGSDGRLVSFTLDIYEDNVLNNSDTFDLQIYGDIPILFVDDDDGRAYESYFTNALDANGYAYMVWDVAARGVSPTAADMIPFQIVIWNTGFDFSGTLSQADEFQLSLYLDNGGNLFLSAQDLLWDIGLTSFVQSYLHVSQYWSDLKNANVEGVSGDPISQDMSLNLVYPFTDYSDDIDPDVTAAPIFTNDRSKPCALRHPASGGSAYKVVFFAFPFEAISPVETDPNNQATVMRRIINWFQTGGELDTSPPAISDATDADGTTGDPVTISATITDYVGVASAAIHYTPIGAGETTVPMTKGGNNVWSAVVPVASDKTGAITYYITAEDAAANPARDPDDPGTYSITVTDNDKPVAVAGSDKSVSVDGPVSFDGSGSSDNVPGIMSYSWDFDANGGVGEDATGETSSHTYTAVGTYTVTLTVTDGAGNTSDPDTLVVTVSAVSAAPETLAVNGPDDIKEPVRASDGNHLVVAANSYVQFQFEDVSGTSAEPGIASVVIYTEHWDGNPFKGDIAATIVGTDLSYTPTTSIPTHSGEETDIWDVTDHISTLDNLNAMQLGIQNNSGKDKQININHIYVEVQWGEPGTDPPTTTTDMYVSGNVDEDVNMDLGYAGPFVYATATLRVVQDNLDSNQGVPEATVYGNWTVGIPDPNLNLIPYPGSGLTDANGYVTLKSKKVKNPETGTVFIFAVTNVDKGTEWRYANTEQPSGSTAPVAAPMFVGTYPTALENAFPSFGNPEIWIPFTLSEAEHVTISIYNMAGRLIRTLDLGQKAPGAYMNRGKAAHWDGKNERGERVSSGIYFYVMKTSSFTAVKKLGIAK